jgi:hypothetical protein
MIPAMRNLIIPAVLLSVAGCGEQTDKIYSTYADARRAGAVERGWMPAFVPSSARDITDSHDMDTNQQTLRFTLPASEAGNMVAGLHPVSATDQEPGANLAKEHGLAAASEAYAVCAAPLNGVLVVDRNSGRAVYDTTVEWVGIQCLANED